MILTDEEIHENYKALRGDKQPRYIEIYRAAEAATLAKLASAKLPSTVWVDVPHFTYTADQLRQAYAQGAAAQLAEKHVGYFDKEFGCIYFDNEVGEEEAKLPKLYTRRQAND